MVNEPLTASACSPAPHATENPQRRDRSGSPTFAAGKASGIFSALAAPSDLRGQSRGGEFTGTTRMVSEQSAFWIAAAQVANLGFRPAKGDLLRLPERCGSPSFAIAAIHPTSMGDLNLLLVREDVAE